jgi:hypothetical protein
MWSKVCDVGTIATAGSGSLMLPGRQRILLGMAVFAAVAGIGCGRSPSPERTQAPPPSLTTAEWQRFTAARVFFAHQSVGENILDGVRTIAAAGLTPAANIVDVTKTAAVSDRPGLFHTAIGVNGDPMSKIHAFRNALEHGQGAKTDVAVLKFCFWDIRKDTDVTRVFREYERTIAELGHEFPALRFVHVTTPLMRRDDDWRARVREVLGRPVPRTLDNARRHELSDLIRQRYSGQEPVFDLEAVESFGPDPGQAPSLAAQLTSDGGHLNAEGRRRAALSFVAAVASTVGDVSPKASR